MAALGEYTNVESTALAVLEQKGYRVWRKAREVDGERWYTFWAEKDGWDFVADSAVALLGLIAIHQHHDPDAYVEYWWRLEGGPDPRTLTEVAPDYVPAYGRRT